MKAGMVTIIWLVMMRIEAVTVVIMVAKTVVMVRMTMMVVVMGYVDGDDGNDDYDGINFKDNTYPTGKKLITPGKRNTIRGLSRITGLLSFKNLLFSTGA